MAYGAQVSLDAKELERLMEAIAEYGSHADEIISEYLREKGGEDVVRGIIPNMPTSGVRWRGKPVASRTAAAMNRKKVFDDAVSGLVLTVKSKKPYNYLYFPDDGSNTLNHAGEQHFMMAGAEAATKEIIDGCIERLVEKMKE